MMNEKLQDYIDKLIADRPALFQEMELFAKENGVPIMEPAGMEALLQLLRIHQPKTILEVGTAIGYSALRMAEALPDTIITTIERDEERYRLACKYISMANKESQISVINGDALEVEEDVKQHGPFDAIFVDAAKGQYKRFFEMYSNFLSNGGLMITDNVLFKGLVYEGEIESRRLRSLVKKINEFNSWLANNPEFHTVILPVGDGVAVSIKR
ncbi:O-methyltransferase [Mesobacillus harenae]|uniref:O-methyltransferase n=1 Tax=Mesobacillus harenae TaxID=2213203 RepID=UPI001580B673|nr:O-methyltransferase [Mesobacillus harenae]